MQTDAHHLGRTCDTLRIKRVETVFKIGVEMLTGVETLRCRKPHVIGIQRVGDHKLRALCHVGPVGQIIGIGVRNIVETAILCDQSHGVFRTSTCVPALGRAARDGGVQALSLRDLGAFLGLGHVFVFDPFQAVAGDFPIGVQHRGHLRG